MICRKCGAEHESLSIGFKAVCPDCGSWLHSCSQCSLSRDGAVRCRSLTTMESGDREALNYCEEFMPNTLPKGSGSGGSSSARNQFNDLFGSGPEG